MRSSKAISALLGPSTAMESPPAPASRVQMLNSAGGGTGGSGGHPHRGWGHPQVGFGVSRGDLGASQGGIGVLRGLGVATGGLWGAPGGFRGDPRWVLGCLWGLLKTPNSPLYPPTCRGWFWGTFREFWRPQTPLFMPPAPWGRFWGPFRDFWRPQAPPGPVLGHIWGLLKPPAPPYPPRDSLWVLRGSQFWVLSFSGHVSGLLNPS